MLSCLGSDCQFNYLQSLHDAALIINATWYEPTALTFLFTWHVLSTCRRNPLTEFVRQLVAKDSHGRADASCQVCTEGGTYSQTIAEVMHAVPHDHHPGNAGDTSILHLLVRVAIPSVGVAVKLRLLLALLGWRSVGVGSGQWHLVCRRLGRLDFCELCVVVAVVTGSGAVFRVWRRSKSVMLVRSNKITRSTIFAIFTSAERFKVQPLCIWATI